MMDTPSTSDILARVMRELHTKHEASLVQIVLTLLPYSYGPHEFTIERYPHQSAVRFRNHAYYVPHPTLNINPTGWGLLSDRQAIDNACQGADL